MKIHFINHACFIVEHNNKKIICDPWLEGDVFNKGWKHISESKFSYNDFKDVDYIWFSHEHPDHFHPPTLKKIPAEIRKNITILFHETKDKRVVDFCSKIGFENIVELRSSEMFNIKDDFEIMCSQFGDVDSWILFKSKDFTFFNANDCGIRNESDALKIKEIIGDIDILLTQFSYAYWAGNEDEIEYRQKIARKKLEMLKFECEMFQPKVVIPIASNIYFCHEQNFYLNDSMNTPRKTFEFIKKEIPNVTPIILFNDDEYLYQNFHNSEDAILKYERDFQKIDSPLLLKSDKIEEHKLLESANKFVNKVKSTKGFVKFVLKSTKIFVKDYEKSYQLSLGGLKEVKEKEENCDVSLWSDSLDYAFNFPFGLDTTQINGRLRKPKNGNYGKFYPYFRIEQLKSHGETWGIKQLVETALRKIAFKLKLRVP